MLINPVLQNREFDGIELDLLPYLLNCKLILHTGFTLLSL
jgi:hypothetical protein